MADVGFSLLDHGMALTAAVVGGVILADGSGLLGFVAGFVLFLPLGYLRRWWMNRRMR